MSASDSYSTLTTSSAILCQSTQSALICLLKIDGQWKFRHETILVRNCLSQTKFEFWSSSSYFWNRWSEALLICSLDLSVYKISYSSIQGGSQEHISLVTIMFCFYWICIHCPSCGLVSKLLPSVLWRCWLGGRKGIRPVKNWVVECWRGYLSGARCRLAHGPADATATHCLLLQ